LTLNRLPYAAVLALLLVTVSAVTACRRSQIAGRAGSTPATPGSLGLPTPEVDEQGYIEGSQWNSAEAAAGFELVVEVGSLTTNSEGKPSSGYLGRAGAALYFRSQAGELSSMPLGGGARSAVALAVPEHMLMAADAREVSWVTPACEIFSAAARFGRRSFVDRGARPNWMSGVDRRRCSHRYAVTIFDTIPADSAS